MAEMQEKRLCNTENFPGTIWYYVLGKMHRD